MLGSTPSPVPSMPLILTLALLVGTLTASVATGLNLAAPIILMCASWSAWDAHRHGARHFQGWMGRGPLGVFFCVALIWFAAFPAWLDLRERIRAGAASPRPGVSADEARRLVMAAWR